ncbi:hypothetical protein CEP54_016082 [Fusarium duplospermum]|uniref:Uncharacterized protein n=1 Tax=Fusarium duplospermum TaxID=1325734 RepID=A0A428NIH5_9HYPO|nr:hypothetical protein CEP54_016082 [Fusarium duplospermum]
MFGLDTDIARLDPRSPAYQAAGDESPGYQDERGNYGEGFVGNYGDNFVGDYGEENVCQNHPELEQRMHQIIEIARGFDNARGSTRTAE